VLFFEAKYLILCDLSTEIDYFIIMWTKESVIVLGVTEAIHLDVNRVVGVPVICIMVVQARIGSWVRSYIYLRVPTSCASVVGAFLLNLRAAQVVEVFLVA
jgi:hypothetical protein